MAALRPFASSRLLCSLGLGAALTLAVLSGCNSATTSEEKAETTAEPAPKPPAAGTSEESADSRTGSTENAKPEQLVSDFSQGVFPRDPAGTPPAPAEGSSLADAGDSSKSEGSDRPEKAETKKDVPPGSDPLVPASANRTDTTGWWRIVFSVNGDDYSAGFVKIGKADGGKFQVEEVRTNDIINPAKTVHQEATDKTVRIDFADGENKFDLSGTLEGNVIRGNVQFHSPRQMLARLVPVEASAVTDAALDKVELGPTFGAQEIVGSLQSKDQVNSLRKVAKTWRNSPVLFMAYDVLLQNAANLKLDRETIQNLTKDFTDVAQIWGDRAVQSAKLNVAADLLMAGYETDLADQELQQVQKDAPELAGYWKDLLTEVRRRGEAEKAHREHVAAVATAVGQIKSGQTDEGLKALRQLHAERPIEPLTTYRLAVAEQEHGDKDAALRLFARLAALPQSESELGDLPAEADYVPPRVAAARLFEAKNGSRDGFEVYLNKIYREEVTSFLTDEDRKRQRPEGGRTVLVEMFTGAMCPPCVAADVATEAIEHSFPEGEAVVLRYHLHIPGPDPLTNSDTEARNDYYGPEVQGTPTILIDGKSVGYNVGGGYSGSPDIYARLADTISNEAKKPPKAKIELSAAPEGESLKITAKATGVENPSDSLRLRVVVAENDVEFPARNGIREHGMIAREMPGGAEGVKATDGEFTLERTVPLTEVRDRLVAYLDRSERQLSRQFGQSFAFGARPLDLKRLTVVAFLQDDATHEVLQTAVAPVGQEFNLPPLPEKKNDAASEKDDEKNADGPSLAPPK